MGAHPYYYSVKYQPDIESALQALRQREFAAGRYNPVEPFLNFPLRPDSPSLGAQHESIDAAREEAAEEGTRSILDIASTANEPDFCVAAPLSADSLMSAFGTAQPTKKDVDGKMDFLETIERGHCIYFTIFKDGTANELFFAGYSFD